ncbi:MAG TPA: hypothetical protein ENH01_03965 [Nitrospirae bacterium]|nr:hypothetical protein [Nitrospirota bacterium]
MKFNVALQESEDGGYDVTVPALDRCFTQGDTMEEAIENAKEAGLISSHIPYLIPWSSACT